MPSNSTHNDSDQFQTLYINLLIIPSQHYFCTTVLPGCCSHKSVSICNVNKTERIFPLGKANSCAITHLSSTPSATGQWLILWKWIRGTWGGEVGMHFLYVSTLIIFRTSGIKSNSIFLWLETVMRHYLQWNTNLFYSIVGWLSEKGRDGVGMEVELLHQHVCSNVIARSGRTKKTQPAL